MEMDVDAGFDSSQQGSLASVGEERTLLGLSNELLLEILGEVHYLQLVRCRAVRHIVVSHACL